MTLLFTFASADDAPRIGLAVGGVLALAARLVGMPRIASAAALGGRALPAKLHQPAG